MRSYQGVAHLGLGELTQARDAFAQAAALAPKAPEPVAGESAVFLRERKFDQSLDRARAALALGPESAEAWNAMGAALHAAGSLREALDAYGKVLALQGSNSEARVSRVGVALDLDDLAEASKELDYLRTNFPSEPRAAYLRSVLLRKQGDVAGSKAAMNAAAQLVAKLPKNILEFQESLLFLGGIANYGLRSFELSEGFLERYIEVRPNDLGARHLLGRIELRQGRNEDAVSLLQPVVEANPDDPRSLSVLATAYSRLGRAADATPLLERALAVDSTNPSTAHQLAVNYIAVKRQRDAISLLRSVLEKHPEATAPAVTLTTLLLTSGDFDGAAETAERALRSNATQQNLRNLLGVAHTRAGRLAAAREAFEQLRQSSFNYLPARINLAKLDIIEGKPDAGVARFKQILRQFPAHAATMLELATHLSDAGKLNDAIGWVKKSLTVDSNSIPANVFLTNLYLRADNAAGALRVAKETESWAPDSHLVKAALARSYFAVGRRDLATVTLREAATNAGYDARVLIGLAGLQSRIGAWEDADWSLQKALVQEPDFIPARVKLIEAQLALGRTEQAKKMTSSLRTQFPEHPAGYGLLGEIATKEGEHEEAVRQFGRALEIQVRDLAAVRYFEARARAGDESAEGWMVQWIMDHPNHQGARRILAEYHMVRGDLAAAKREYTTLITEYRPRDATLWNNLANIQLALGEPEARASAERAIALAPDDPNVSDTLGWILIQEGEVKNGLSLLRKAQSMAAENPEIHYHLGVALHRLSRTSEATRELELAVESRQNFAGRDEAEQLLKTVKK